MEGRWGMTYAGGKKNAVFVVFESRTRQKNDFEERFMKAARVNIFC